MGTLSAQLFDQVGNKKSCSIGYVIYSCWFFPAFQYVHLSDLVIKGDKTLNCLTSGQMVQR